jgi:hypothetical protein
MGYKIKAEMLILYDPVLREKETKERMIDKFKSLQELLDKSLEKRDINDQKIIENSVVLVDIKPTLLSPNESILETVTQTLNSLRNEISGLDFKHKTTKYKRLDREIFKLMVKLDDIDAENDSSIDDKRKKIVTEIHGLFKILDEKVDCKQQDCIICKTGIELNNKNKNNQN